MFVTAFDISQLIEGEIVGDPGVKIERPSKIEEATEGCITFLANPRYEQYAYTTRASAILVGQDFVPSKPISATLIRVKDVYGALGALLNHFQGENGMPGGISELAFVDANADVAEGVSVGAFTVIKKGVSIGVDSVICEQVFIGENVSIGRDVLVYPGARIYSGVKIGDHCIIHSNAVIGSDGFGYSIDDQGAYHKIPQIGTVEIHNHVEIGANTVIDRATMGATVIEQGVKLDNLIQVAHNVEIGSNSVVAAQAGIAGSTKIGRNVQVGGQTGFIGHIQIADGTRLQAQSGVMQNIEEENQILYGSPAFERRAFLKSYILFKQLPEMAERIRNLEKELVSLRGDSPNNS